MSLLTDEDRKKIEAALDTSLSLQHLSMSGHNGVVICDGKQLNTPDLFNQLVLWRIYATKALDALRELEERTTNSVERIYLANEQVEALRRALRQRDHARQWAEYWYGYTFDPGYAENDPPRLQGDDDDGWRTMNAPCGTDVLVRISELEEALEMAVSSEEALCTDLQNAEERERALLDRIDNLRDMLRVAFETFEHEGITTLVRPVQPEPFNPTMENWLDLLRPCTI